MVQRKKGRRFEWVRASGVLNGSDALDPGSTDAADLFANVKSVQGASGNLTDVTVTVIRGYVRPNTTFDAAGGVTKGRFGIRICEQLDLVSPGLTWQRGPGSPGSTDENSYLDWFGYMPWILDDGMENPPGTWARPASPWHVSIESQRIVKSYGMTLGLFTDGVLASGGSAGVGDFTVDYDLSIGIKWP